MGMISTGNDVFVSYARDDDIASNMMVSQFCILLSRLLGSEARSRGVSVLSDRAMVFQDTTGLSTNGDMSHELKMEVLNSEFLVIFVGQAYPRSIWCGQELATFSQKFGEDRRAALEKTFIIVTEQAAFNRDWGEFFGGPNPPIYQKFFDNETGQTIPHHIEVEGKGVHGPRFHNEVREIARGIINRSQNSEARRDV